MQSNLSTEQHVFLLQLGPVSTNINEIYPTLAVCSSIYKQKWNIKLKRLNVYKICINLCSCFRIPNDIFISEIDISESIGLNL